MKKSIFKAKICLSVGPDFFDLYYSDNPFECELWLDEQVRSLGFENVKSACVICISYNNNNN